MCKSGVPKFHTSQSRKIWHFGQHICLFLKVKTAYVSITSCLGTIVWCFQFFRVSSPSGKGASREPPTPLGNFCPWTPLPLGSDLLWGGYGYFWEPHNFVLIKHCSITCFSERNLPLWYLQTSFKGPFERVIRKQRRNIILKSVKSCKNWKKTHGRITLERDINLVQIPHPSKATFKFPPPQARCTVKCPWYAQGEEVEASIWPVHYSLTCPHYSLPIMRTLRSIPLASISL